jgi:hypothetical protein
MAMYPTLREEDFFHTSLFCKGWPAAFVRQSFGQHGERRFPLALREITNLYFLSHSSVGYGMAADIMGDAARALDGLLDTQLA